MNDKFNPNFYTDLADDSAMIQAAVDAAAKVGEAVTIPRLNQRTGKRIWEITTAIRLYDDSVIFLDNCHLRQADGVNTCIFCNSYYEELISRCRTGRQKHICIIGKGNAVLDGGEPTGLTQENLEENGVKHLWANSMINMVNVGKVKIENLNIVNPRFWAMTFQYSTHIHIKDIHMQCPGLDRDCINVHVGCSHVTVDNVTANTAGSAVALTNLQNYRERPMRDCRYDDSIHNVTIHNVRGTAGRSLIKLLNHGGRKIYNVFIRNVVTDCESDPADPRPGLGLGKDEYVPIHPEIYNTAVNSAIQIGFDTPDTEDTPAQLGDTYNITIEDVVSRSAAAICIPGTAKDVLIGGVRVFAHGGAAAYIGSAPVKNVMLRDVYFAGERAAAAEDSKQACAVYFDNADVQEFVVQDIQSGNGHTALFGGSGKGQVQVSGVNKRWGDIPTNGCAGELKVVED